MLVLKFPGSPVVDVEANSSNRFLKLVQLFWLQFKSRGKVVLKVCEDVPKVTDYQFNQHVLLPEFCEVYSRIIEFDSKHANFAEISALQFHAPRTCALLRSFTWSSIS